MKFPARDFLLVSPKAFDLCKCTTTILDVANVFFFLTLGVFLHAGLCSWHLMLFGFVGMVCLSFPATVANPRDGRNNLNILMIRFVVSAGFSDERS